MGEGLNHAAIRQISLRQSFIIKCPEETRGTDG